MNINTICFQKHFLKRSKKHNAQIIGIIDSYKSYKTLSHDLVATLKYIRKETQKGTEKRRVNAKSLFPQNQVAI